MVKQKINTKEKIALKTYPARIHPYVSIYLYTPASLSPSSPPPSPHSSPPLPPIRCNMISMRGKEFQFAPSSAIFPMPTLVTMREPQMDPVRPKDYAQRTNGISWCGQVCVLKQHRMSNHNYNRCNSPHWAFSYKFTNCM